ncbi:MAG: site-2 protease family protein [Bacilli bacterium]
MTIYNKLNISYLYISFGLLCTITGLFREFIVFSSIIIFHEFGHIFIALKKGYTINKINVYPFGGFTNLSHPINIPIKNEFILIIFGFIFQLLFFIIIIFLFNINLIRESTFNLHKIYNINIFLFNILPILPLDGGKLLNLLLNKFLSFKTSHFLSIILSIIIILLIFFNSFNNLNILILMLVLGQKVLEEYKNRKFIFSTLLLERYLNKYKFTKVKVINNPNKIMRDKKHVIKYKGKFLTEKQYLKYRYK